MQAYLEVADGRYAGTTLALSAGGASQVGSRLGVDLFLPDDASLAPVHFALTCDGWRCQLRDCESGKPTWLNGQSVKRAILKHQDWIVAGETLFWFFVENQPVSEVETTITRLIAHLNDIQTPLYALIDTTLSPRLEALTEEMQDEAFNYQPEIKAMQYATARPWLLRVPRRSDFLTRLVRTAWGKGACVFLTSDARFSSLRDQFGELLLINYAGGKDAGFRFFDPRVLRVLLSEGEPEPVRDMFRHVSSYLVESQLPHSLLEFRVANTGVSVTSKRFSIPKSKIPSQQEFQTFFATTPAGGEFYPNLIDYLRQHMPTETENQLDADLLLLIKQSEQEAARYGIRSQPARAQYSSLAVALEGKPGRIPGVDNCLQQPGLPGEEKLRMFVENFNLRRG